MTQRAINDALRERLATTPGAPPILWENAEGVWDGAAWVMPAPPFWRAYTITNPPVRVTTDAQVVDRTGMFVVAVLVAESTLLNVLETQAESIVARFPVDLLVTGAGGTVARIAQPPYYADPYDDGAYYRTNVFIPWRQQR